MLLYRLAIKRHAQDVALDVDDAGVEDPLLSGNASGHGSDFSGWTVPGALTSHPCRLWFSILVLLAL